MAKKKATKKVAAPAKSEHNVFKITLTSLILWGIVLIFIVEIYQKIIDHAYMLYH